MAENSRANYVTPFGKELRKLRIDFDENQSRQAKRLGIAPGTLSRIEKGHTAPGAIAQKVVESYGLDDYQQQMIEAAAEASISKVVFDFTTLSAAARDKFYDRIMALKEQVEEFEADPAMAEAPGDVDDARPAPEETGSTDPAPDKSDDGAVSESDEHTDDELEAILAGADGDD